MADLSSIDKLKFEKLFDMGTGYVIDFSNRTFSEFILENTGIDISNAKYNYGSGSKANRLRAFWQKEEDHTVGQLLLKLLEYWMAKKETDYSEITPAEKTLYDECMKIAEGLARKISIIGTNSPIIINHIYNGAVINQVDFLNNLIGSIRKLRVFLCHASNDKSIVENYYSTLLNDGIDAWLDKKSLIPGQDWQIEIPKAVKNSDVVIVFLSSHSVNKEGFVQKEIKIALDTADEKPDGTIFIIPARLEDCEVPGRLRKFHWVDLFDEDGYERLFGALQLRARSLSIVVNRNASSFPK